ncbi:MAG: hypothetical protein AAFR56_21175 [Chloroflexota bacterium]
MRFVLFTDKTPSQCMKALHERMDASPTKSRPELNGWIEKSGSFSISLRRQVFGKLSRTTKLRGTADRESGVTVIRGSVPEGVNRRWLTIIALCVAALSAYMFLSGELMIATMIVLAGFIMLVPLWGDHRNHDVLLYELEKALKAKPAPRDEARKLQAQRPKRKPAKKKPTRRTSKKAG